MRGSSLSSPEVVALLEPFIVTSWHGHRDSDPPAVVRHLWARPRRGQSPRDESNVKLAVLDSAGNLVHSFDGFPKRPGNRRGPLTRHSLSDHTAHEIRRALRELDTSAEVASHPLTLPDFTCNEEEADSSAAPPSAPVGVRVFVQLSEIDDGYGAPVVELVEATSDEWRALAHPGDEPTAVDPQSLIRWIAEIYPPGMMEMTDSRSKHVNRIEEVTGNLVLSPAGTDGETRYAILHGKVTVHFGGSTDLSYSGDLQLALSYESQSSTPTSLQGVFDGVYPRDDGRRHRVRELRLTAALESRPR